MKFGVIMPWPGVKNAEFEFIERLIIASQNTGHECVVLSNDGKVVIDNRVLSSRFIKPQELDFVLSLHFTTPKLTDHFYYYALWNPPLYLTRQVEYSTYLNNTLMNDDYIGYDSEGILEHTKIMLGDHHPHNLDDMPTFVPSVPKSLIKRPKLPKKPVFFYCGVNWEKCSSSKGRHHELFKKLDTSKLVKIFGPEKFEGVKPWDGFKSFEGSIPFDGKSVIDEIHDCGISLVLSSDEHRKSGAASNRVYESAAAGAVIISDNNPFVKKVFGDNVLYVDYTIGDHTGNYKQIKRHYDWIVENPEAALKKAAACQDILVSRFALEDQLQSLVNHHEQRKAKHASLFFSQKTDEPIDVVLLWDKKDDDKFDALLKNIEIQNYPHIALWVVCDQSLENSLDKKLKKKNISFQIVALNWFDMKFGKPEKDYKLLDQGEAIQQVLPKLTADTVAFLTPDALWFSDHLTTLKRAFEDHKVTLAYSGSLAHNTSEKNRKTRFFDIQKEKDLCNFLPNIHLSQCLIKRDLCQNYLPHLGFLNGHEVFLWLLDAHINKKSAFTGRMTHGVMVKDRDAPLPDPEQARFIKQIFRFDLPFDETYTNDMEKFGSEVMAFFRAATAKRRWPKKILRGIFGRGLWKSGRLKPEKR
jgi:hypothetical protein